MKASTQRFLGVLIHQSTTKDHDLHNALNAMKFFKFKGDTIMIKTMKENIKIPKFKKPLYIPTYISTAVP